MKHKQKKQTICLRDSFGRQYMEKLTQQTTELWQVNS